MRTHLLVALIIAITLAGCSGAAMLLVPLSGAPMETPPAPTYSETEIEQLSLYEVYRFDSDRRIVASPGVKDRLQENERMQATRPGTLPLTQAELERCGYRFVYYQDQRTKKKVEVFAGAPISFASDDENVLVAIYRWGERTTTEMYLTIDLLDPEKMAPAKYPLVLPNWRSLKAPLESIPDFVSISKGRIHMGFDEKTEYTIASATLGPDLQTRDFKYRVIPKGQEDFPVPDLSKKIGCEGARRIR